MSKISELQETQKGYMAALGAVKKTRPGAVEIDLFHDEERNGETLRRRVGSVSYFPEHDHVVIEKHGGGSLCFNSGEILHVIKALRELTE